MTRAALFLLLAGCFNKPGLVGNGDAGGDDGGACTPSHPTTSGVFVEDDNGETVVHMIASTVRLASDGNRYPFPTSINLGGQELIAGPEGCSHEDQIGVAVYPAYSIAGNQPLMGPSLHRLTRVHQGHAYSELQIEWTYTHDCPSGDLEGNGVTTFGFFPDGRIVRNDSLQPISNSASADTTHCPCLSSSAFRVTSYMNLNREQLTTYRRADLNMDSPFPNGEDFAGIGGCVTTDEGDQVAVAFPTGTYTRFRSVAADEATWVLDFVEPGSATTLGDADAFSGTTQIMLRNDGLCEDVNRELQNHMQPSQISVGNDTITVGPNGYFDAGEQTGPITVTASNGRIEQGFSIRIQLRGYSSLYTDRLETRVFWQHEEDDVFFLTFRDGMASGESFVITPECGS